MANPGVDATSSQVPESPLFDIKQVPGKGKGLVARIDIPTGTRIFREKPLLIARNMSPHMLQKDLEPKIKALAKDQQRQFLCLHNNFPGQYAFAGIVKTNALPCGSGAMVGAVYPTICLVNHSCMPNSHTNWNEDAGHETIHATRFIKAGEEITIAYDKGGTSDTRRASLKQSFGFDCDCPVCSLGIPELQASDTRRLQIQALDDAIGDPFRMRSSPAASLADCHSLLGVLDEEYGTGRAVLARLYYDAFQICIAHSDQARATVFAERAYKSRVVCEGEGSPLTQKMKRMMENPAGHPNFGGYSKNWKTSKSQVPKSLDAVDFEKWLWRQGR
ncbi:SET domain-containing protein [Coniochaeta ligniaria NRRL 30616]|uniref:SET domain-containing protein n=1 Tax=Coniochaeta ligniaria NRRL 30616 TaxID=1408157 RepID=A0A1J7I960_9PEZI|nr:SET domain-containing protein [Coniochaeta ligniaria NRRL 30616]